MNISISAKPGQYVKYVVVVQINKISSITHHNLNFADCCSLVQYYVDNSYNLQTTIGYDIMSKKIINKVELNPDVFIVSN